MERFMEAEETAAASRKRRREFEQLGKRLGYDIEAEIKKRSFERWKNQ